MHLASHLIKGMKKYMEDNHQFIADNETLEGLSQEFIFHKILQSTNDEDQFIPMLMYALYKQDKVKFIVQEKNIGKIVEVDKHKLINFQKEKMKDTSIQEYKNQAKQILENTINILLNNKKDEIEDKEKTINKKEKELATKEKNLDKKEKELNKREKNCPKATPFWHGILQGVLSTVVIYFLSALFLINRVNIFEMLSKIYK